MERSSVGMLMEWSPKTPSLWDWESPAFFGGNPRQEWGTDAGSVYSGSELGNASSSKSPASISIDSSPHAGTRTPGLNFEAAAQGPTTATLAVGPHEPPIGLKLGKRTYFEDVCPGSGAKNPSSSSASSSPSAAPLTRPSRASHQTAQTFRCQVEGCNIDLTGAKDYHRKHRVCGSHSKCPRVIVAGQERRFCQQCSRFHELSAFDDQKRSCRKRLSDHNARRRKPQPGTVTFNSARFSSPLHDDRQQQMNLLLNSASFGHIRPSASSTWQGSCDFKLAHVKGSWMKSTKGSNEGQLPLPGTDLSNAFSTLRHDLDRLLPFKSTTADVLNQVPEASMVASNLDGAPDLRRALSLLSTDSWGSAELGPATSLAQTVHTNQSRLAQPMIHAVNSASHYWQDEAPRAVPFAMHSNVSQFQLLKAPYETSLIDSNQIH